MIGLDGKGKAVSRAMLNYFPRDNHVTEPVAPKPDAVILVLLLENRLTEVTSFHRLQQRQKALGIKTVEVKSVIAGETPRVNVKVGNEVMVMAGQAHVVQRELLRRVICEKVDTHSHVTSMAKRWTSEKARLDVCFPPLRTLVWITRAPAANVR